MTTSEKGHIMTRLVKLRETLGDMVANVVIYYYFQDILIHETLMGARCRLFSQRRQYTEKKFMVIIIVSKLLTLNKHLPK